MNRKLISKAFTHIDDALIAEALVSPAVKGDRSPERTIPMGKYETKKHPVRSRRIFSLILAACLVMAMAVTAYAFNFLGIREMLPKLPDTAAPHIQPQTETKAEEDWSARITESLCDDTKIMVTVTVSGGDKYIIAPTDADPDTLAVNIGIQGDMTLGELTLGEYAAQQGKELLFVGATLKENASLGGNGSQAFRNVTDSEMTILITADKTAALTEKEIICHIYAVNKDWNKLTLDIPFSLTEAPSGETGPYVPVDADAIPGITVGEATVTETPLGLSIRFRETITDNDAFYNVMKVEFEGLTYGQGGSVLEDDGNWYLSVTGCTGELGKTLTVHYYDWDSQLIRVDIEEIVSTRNVEFVGVESQIFTCRGKIGGKMRMFDLKYMFRSHCWYLCRQLY